MNYPIWELPSSGLLIAAIAIVHVFISHFAVGGGLFLVLAERKARAEGDVSLLGFVEGLSRFFVLLTLVLGAVTGVGIWFTIGLVHPQATSSLINTFVWGWAIEWTFFFIEIAAATVYYYGWKRLDARSHLLVGWIYFWSAWLSLVVINGILAYMLTPGRWLDTHAFWDGFFNPTYVSSVVMRTLVSVGLAGLYALFAASLGKDGALKDKVARWAGAYWILPAAIGIPLTMIWYLADARGAGIPVDAIFGASGTGIGPLIGAVLAPDAASGYPMAQMAARVAAIAFPAIIVLTLAVLLFRRERYGPAITSCLLVIGFAGMGAGEWAREDLRKPWVIGEVMYVNGVRAEARESAPKPPTGLFAGDVDPFSRAAIDRDGVLKAAHFARVPAGWIHATGPDDTLDPTARALVEEQAGEQVFKLLCSSCHTVDGYVAVRPLVQGFTVAGGETLLARLETHRGRRMPPFTGTLAERRALAVYLARLGGDAMAGVEAAAPVSTGAQLFESQCALCHAEDGDFPLGALIEGKSTDAIFAMLGRLPEINEMMEPFVGTDDERRALAEFLTGAKSPAEDPLVVGRRVFDDNCLVCHDATGEFALSRTLAGKSAEDIAAQIGRLPEIDAMMPAFTGTDDERRALALWLASPQEEAR